MKIASRGYDETDFASVMTFLRETLSRTRSYQNWFPPRFENSLVGQDGLPRVIDAKVWEEIDDSVLPMKRRIVALSNPEAPGDYFIQIDPAFTHLEREILEWIVEHHSEGRGAGGRSELAIHTIEGNLTRESLLAEMGFQRGQTCGYLRLRPFDSPVPDFHCREGFEIRSVRGETDYDELARVTRLAFNKGEWYDAHILQTIARMSFYREDLDLIAVAPNGEFASFCTFRMDPISRITELEPVGTHPDYRGLGLAKALISNGLRRTLEYDPALICISGAADTPAANSLYESVGFTEKFAEYCWVRGE
jgi:ribosomal protein S18 acetylase RimI-like enzyme